MKSWKKTWKAQLDKVVPPLDENIKNMPVSASPQANVNTDGTLTRSKKLTISIASLLAAILIIGIALACTLPFMNKPAAETFLFTVEINPSATIVTDKNGTVTSVVSSNADADVILSDKNTVAQIIGKPLDKAIAAYTDRASMLGYIDMSKTGSAVRISACEKGEELLNSAQSALKSYFIDKGIFAVVLGETVSLEEFSSRSGFIADSISGLSSKISECETLFNGREAQNADLNKLIALYKDNILSETLMNSIKDFIYENLDRIKPFEGLIGISTDSILRILDDFTEDVLLQYSSTFTKILNLIGLSDSPVVKVIKLPENLQEFMQALSNALEMELNYRKAEFESIYNSAQSITEKAYEDFVDAVIGEYGSLENYWKEIK